MSEPRVLDAQLSALVLYLLRSGQERLTTSPVGRFTDGRGAWHVLSNGYAAVATREPLLQHKGGVPIAGSILKGIFTHKGGHSPRALDLAFALHWCNVQSLPSGRCSGNSIADPEHRPGYVFGTMFDRVLLSRVLRAFAPVSVTIRLDKREILNIEGQDECGSEVRAVVKSLNHNAEFFHETKPDLFPDALGAKT